MAHCLRFHNEKIVAEPRKVQIDIFRMSPPPYDENQYYGSVRHPSPQSVLGGTSVSWLSETQNKMKYKIIPEECRPLLFKPLSRTISQNGDDVEMVRDEIENHRGKLLKVEFVKILKTSGPVIFAYMLQNSLQTGSVLVVGRLVSLLRSAYLTQGSDELAVAAFSYMAAMSTAWLSTFLRNYLSNPTSCARWNYCSR
jgi:hypothetical protein